MKIIFNSIQRDLIGGLNQFSANVTEIPDHKHYRNAVNRVRAVLQGFMKRLYNPYQPQQYGLMANHSPKYCSTKKANFFSIPTHLIVILI